MMASLESPGNRAPLGDDPRDHVRNLLWRQRPSPGGTSPVRHSEVRSPCNDRRPHVLIAHECQVGRVGDTPAARIASPVLAVTGGAGAGKNLPTALAAGAVAGCCSWYVVRRNLLSGDGVRARPSLLDAANEDIDLLISERAARLERERGLRRSGHADGDDLA